MMIRTMPADKKEDSAIAKAAHELVDRYGVAAAGEAAARATALANEARWPEHDLALRLLTAVEELLGPQK